MASIPDFNYNNVLPPHLGNPTDTSKISPYKTDIMEFCKKFATSSESCLLYTSPSPRDRQKSRMPSSA